MAIPANRLILPPPRTAVALELGALLFWSAFEAYLIVFMAPPPIVIFFLSLGLLVFLLPIVISRKASSWEVDPTGIRRTLGRRVIARISFQEVGSVETTHNPTLRLAVLRVRDRKGRVRLALVSGARASPSDVQFLHQAIGQRARAFGIPVTPFIELPPELELPLDVVRTAHGQRPSARVFIRMTLNLIVALLVPLLIVFLLVPTGGFPAEFLYVILLWMVVILFISPRTTRFRKRVVAILPRFRKR